MSTWRKNSASRTGAASRRAHDHKRGAPVEQEAFDRPGPLDEAGVHGLEQDEELGDVLQELRAEHPIGDLVEGPGGDVDHAAPVGRNQQPQQARGEELGHPLRGLR